MSTYNSAKTTTELNLFRCTWNRKFRDNLNFAQKYEQETKHDRHQNYIRKPHARNINRITPPTSHGVSNFTEVILLPQASRLTAYLSSS